MWISVEITNNCHPPLTVEGTPHKYCQSIVYFLTCPFKREEEYFPFPYLRLPFHRYQDQVSNVLNINMFQSWDKRLKCLLNISKLDLAATFFPHSLVPPVTRYGWHTLPYILKGFLSFFHMTPFRLRGLKSRLIFGVYGMVLISLWIYRQYVIELL